MSNPTPTLEEMALCSVSPCRLDPIRRARVYAYMEQYFLKGDGDQKRQQAKEVVRHKIANALKH